MLRYVALGREKCRIIYLLFPHALYRCLPRSQAMYSVTLIYYALLFELLFFFCLIVSNSIRICFRLSFASTGDYLSVHSLLPWLCSLLACSCSKNANNSRFKSKTVPTYSQALTFISELA